jgi:lipopolysaccharide transport system ATP-binding protein
MKPIIRIQNLGKCYRIRGSAAPYATLRESITGAMRIPRVFKKNAGLDAPNAGGRRESPNGAFQWVLRNIDLEFKAGEVVGIIGRNGAGKSTLLKILSRITEPTTGRVELYGRVGSLLEVGTGFHPELTGRENIALNGAILGMGRRAMSDRRDEIIAFAEVEKFIDTPVKHYSSGMYLRLAFAVAAHLDPEVLVVDEVLAVGDIRFQRKCLDKMRSVSSEGRTILFVSHNLNAIARMCDRSILLDGGRLVGDGPTQDVAAVYLSEGEGTAAAHVWNDPRRAPGNDTVRLRAVRIRDEDGAVTAKADIRKPIGVELSYDVLVAGSVLIPSIHVYNDQGICVFIAHDWDERWRNSPRPVGHYQSTAWIPGNFLAEGSLSVGAAMATYIPHEVHFHVPDAVAFMIIDSLDGDSARGDFSGHLPGAVRPLLGWSTRQTTTPVEPSCSLDPDYLAVTRAY